MALRVVQLEEMVQQAIKKGMKLYALTEHMPREKIDFYPEEVRQWTMQITREQKMCNIAQGIG